MSIISTDTLIEKPNQNKMVVVLSEDDFKKATENYEDGKFLLNDNISYLVKPSEYQIEKSQYPEVKTLYDEEAFKSGNILMLNKSEENTRYLPYEMVMEKTIRAQLFAFIELCQLMGAKKVALTLSQAENENTSTKMEASLDVEGVMNAKTGVNNDIAKSVLGEMEAETVFDGSSKPNLEKASSLMKSGIFDNNEAIIAFHNTARNVENRIKSQKVKIKLAENVSKNLEVFANLDVPVLKKSLGEASLNRVKNLSKVCEVNYTVTF